MNFYFWSKQQNQWKSFHFQNFHQTVTNKGGKGLEFHSIKDCQSFASNRTHNFNIELWLSCYYYLVTSFVVSFLFILKNRMFMFINRQCKHNYRLAIVVTINTNENLLSLPNWTQKSTYNEQPVEIKIYTGDTSFSIEWNKQVDVDSENFWNFKLCTIIDSHTWVSYI